MGLAVKIVRQQKYLRATMGGVEDDEMNEEEEEAREDQVTWSKRKGSFYDADEAASSDEELPQEEEAEVLRLQREKAKSLSMEDFGLEDTSEDERDTEPTLGDIAVRGDTKVSVTKSTGDDGAATYEEIKKDLDALSKEEQMDVVYSSAPELVGLLSELNDATEELESQINPLLSKVRDGGNITKEGLRYLEVKQILLLAYCQAITFYLLLKSEGQSVRDHPVIGRLVEIKTLLDKVKELDGNLPTNLEAILDQNNAAKTVKLKVQGETTLSFDSFSKDKNFHAAKGGSRELANAVEAVKLAKLDSAGGENKQGKQTTNNGQFGVQSMKMLKVRASLEEKLRQKGQLSSAASKEERNKKQQKPMNGRLETRDDFDDDASGNLGANNKSSLSQSHAVSSLLVAKQKKPKVISGDDDLPKRDDIGERRNKFERRVLQRAGVGSEDEAQDDGTLDADLGSSPEGSEADESEDEFYQQVKREKEAKLAAKSEKFSRTTIEEPFIPETVDGKRHITYQIEKNRGLTRKRKKEDKNPRKKYRSKHEKASVRRKGQVREIRKPSGPYGGEATGINAGISRSIRFKG